MVLINGTCGLAEAVGPEETHLKLQRLSPLAVAPGLKTDRLIG